MRVFVASICKQLSGRHLLASYIVFHIYNSIHLLQRSCFSYDVVRKRLTRIPLTCPQVVGFHMESSLKYKFTGAFSEAALVTFAEGLRDGSVEPDYKSEDVPTGDDAKDGEVTFLNLLCCVPFRARKQAASKTGASAWVPSASHCMVQRRGVGCSNCPPRRLPMPMPAAADLWGWFPWTGGRHRGQKL